MNKQLLERTAMLARLDISGREDLLLSAFSAMVESCAGMPAAEEQQPQELLCCPLREDIPAESLPRACVLMGAKKVENGCIAAPRAFD